MLVLVIAMHLIAISTTRTGFSPVKHAREQVEGTSQLLTFDQRFCEGQFVEGCEKVRLKIDGNTEKSEK